MVLHLAALPAPAAGKVAGILYRGRHISSETVLLLDADIVLEPTALEELVSFHWSHRASSCPDQDRGPDRGSRKSRDRGFGTGDTTVSFRLP